MKRTNLWQNTLQSFWFLPALYGIVSIVLAIVAVNIDFSLTGKELKTIVPAVLVPDSKLVVKLLSTLTTATLTMTTITFSTIMVVLTTFSGQFSPRTLQNFIADRKVQNILAIFVGGFVYDLVAFLQLKSPGKESLFVTPILAGMIAIIGVAAFVYLINHVAKWVQVNNLINRLTLEAIETIDHLDNDIRRYQEDSRQEWSPNFDAQTAEEGTITTKQPGYVGLIDFGTLMNYIEKDDITVRMNVYLGDYVVTGMKLLSYSQDPDHPVTNIDKYRSCVKVGVERTGVQDIEFEIQKLVEIDLRAISPSTNDPHTAINCINRIGEILIQLGNKEWLRPELYDTQRQQRLTIKQHDFSYYLYKAFFQLRHYGNEDVSVTTAILHVLKLIAGHAPTNLHDTIWKFAEYIFSGFNQEVLLPLDEDYLKHELYQIAEMTGHEVTEEMNND
ncbi:DUF2254 domain-containing protein [Halobacillus shinanisalinarum]|uniref:DUF2254 domain-containing protein n=1 Tax=Halobacillus shinanisalinarum TaxID=2932258 RepID=A0ABY4GU37_9BACI|nr:DUF2254 domain-containing protein [Halobacillus shinanisalinarum]UOQ91539.1 DUF2254 domain-containing protein [Halobacillus shinanisalinarum]